MTIHTRIHRAAEEIDEIHVSVTGGSLPKFVECINRAMNCWADAPKELKDFADILTHGRVTQDHTYHKLSKDHFAYTNTPEYISVFEEIKAEYGPEKFKSFLYGDRVELNELIKARLKSKVKLL